MLYESDREIKLNPRKNNPVYGNIPTERVQFMEQFMAFVYWLLHVVSI